VLDRVAGEDVVVADLTPAGVEPHDVELTPKQVVALAEARLTVLIGGGFQPSVEDALASTDGTTLDVLDPLAPDLIEGDPHIWLDPRLLASVGDAVAESLADVGLGPPDELTDNAAELRAELEELDQRYSSTLQDCERRELVTAHDAFAYLARRYELEPIAIAGLDPAAEPSAARLGEIAELARDRGVTTIFTESLVSPRVAETVASEAGVETAVLDPIETQPADGDYFTAMERNLDALSEALGCRP
jgi:zinc transport system substrate-binding protein